MKALEVNFDGLAGPTHHFAGLSFGNVASRQNRLRPSYPRKAALQGLAKMALLMRLGVAQGWLPPHARPCLPALEARGFRGRTLTETLARAYRGDRATFYAAFSSSFMWAANAAIVSPSADTADHRLHLTPANLSTYPHRALETAFTSKVLQRIFADPRFFRHHAPLSSHKGMGDEGAANHLRVTPAHDKRGLEIFVYGSSRHCPKVYRPQRFPARQQREASAAIVARHALGKDNSRLVRQNPAAIDAGVFHNDVIVLNNENVVILHERAWAKQENCLRAIQRQYAMLHRQPLSLHVIPEQRLSVRRAIMSYFFNSQLVTLPGGERALIAPEGCRNDTQVRRVIRDLVEAKAFERVYFVNVNESLANGGGPACLRLRVVLRPDELQAVHPAFLLTPARLEQLRRWVKRYYPEKIFPRDLQDPLLLRQAATALDQLTVLLKIPSLYAFQRC